MTLMRQDDDLFAEPSLDEALADPVVQAVMLRDGVSRDELLRVALAARARLLAGSQSVVTAFPMPGRPAGIGGLYRGPRVRRQARASLPACR